VEDSTLWQKTVTDLKEGLLAAENPPGTRFPSLTELSRDYGVSKITALRVVAELEKSGLVKRIPRRGTFIVGRHQPQSVKVLLDFRQHWAANAFPLVWRYLRGIEAACRKSHCEMQMVSLEYISAKLNPQDRYILLATDPESTNYQCFIDSGCRHLFLHSSARLSEHDCIRADYHCGGTMMTNVMLDAGHTRIAYIGGPPTSHWHAPRIRGYLDALEAKGIPMDLKLIGEITSSFPRPEDAQEELGRLLAMAEPPTAIVTSDDLRALAVLTFLEGQGVRVPEDIALSGMDGRVEAIERKTPLTTCDWLFEKQGEMAVDQLLFPPASAESPNEVILEPRFVAGGTV